MKKSQLDKLLGRKIAAGANSRRGGGGIALGKREQALARKRELLEKSRKS